MIDILQIIKVIENNFYFVIFLFLIKIFLWGRKQYDLFLIDVNSEIREIEYGISYGKIGVSVKIYFDRKEEFIRLKKIKQILNYNKITKIYLILKLGFYYLLNHFGLVKYCYINEYKYEFNSFRLS